MEIQKKMWSGARKNFWQRDFSSVRENSGMEMYREGLEIFE